MHYLLLLTGHGLDLTLLGFHKALEGPEYSEDLEWNQCIVTCLRNCLCKSLNFRPKPPLCEINYDTAKERNLQNRRGLFYYEKNGKNYVNFELLIFYIFPLFLFLTITLIFSS